MSITAETRREAYEEIKPRIPLRAQRILDAIIEHGPMTADELMAVMGYSDPNMVRPRLTELKDSGVLTAIDKRKSLRSGKLVAVWAINEQKRAAPGAANTEDGKA